MSGYEERFACLLLDESEWVASCQEDVLECGNFCSEVGSG